MKALIVDLDGTLCNIEHRRHFIQRDKKDWFTFNSPEQIIKDELNKWCSDIIRNLPYRVIIVTGRESTTPIRQATELWLVKNSIPYDELYMRQINDHRHDFIVKKEIYYSHIMGKYDQVIVLEDRQQVVDMWRSLNITTLQCAKGDY